MLKVCNLKVLLQISHALNIISDLYKRGKVQRDPIRQTCITNNHTIKQIKLTYLLFIAFATVSALTHTRLSNIRL